MNAVEDQSATIPGERTSELGGSIYIVRRAQSRINQAALWGERRESLEGVGEGRLDVLLCSRNERPQKGGRGTARPSFLLAEAASGQKSSGGQRWNGWGKCRRNEVPSVLDATLRRPALGMHSRV